MRRRAIDHKLEPIKLRVQNSLSYNYWDARPCEHGVCNGILRIPVAKLSNSQW